MIVVHAAPNTQPGGVQGAFIIYRYQSDETPFDVNKPPIANAAKFKTRNSKNREIILGHFVYATKKLWHCSNYLSFIKHQKEVLQTPFYAHHTIRS